MPKKRITINVWVCSRCGYEWREVSGKPVPIRCAKCRSPYWNLPKKPLTSEYTGWLRRAKNFVATDELLDIEELARRLGESESTIEEYTRTRGKTKKHPLPHFKIGKKLKFNWSKVVEWVDKMEKEAQSKGGTIQ